MTTFLDSAVLARSVAVAVGSAEREVIIGIGPTTSRGDWEGDFPRKTTSRPHHGDARSSRTLGSWKPYGCSFGSLTLWSLCSTLKAWSWAQWARSGVDPVLPADSARVARRSSASLDVAGISFYRKSCSDRWSGPRCRQRPAPMVAPRPVVDMFPRGFRLDRSVGRAVSTAGGSATDRHAAKFDNRQCRSR